MKDYSPIWIDEATDWVGVDMSRIGDEGYRTGGSFAVGSGALTNVIGRFLLGGEQFNVAGDMRQLGHAPIPLPGQSTRAYQWMQRHKVMVQKLGHRDLLLSPALMLVVATHAAPKIVQRYILERHKENLLGTVNRAYLRNLTEFKKCLRHIQARDLVPELTVPVYRMCRRFANGRQCKDPTERALLDDLLAETLNLMVLYVDMTDVLDLQLDDC